ncbi:hypothetical protein HDU76_001757 [Blyttiomyces sp. JEL0837]|nr:hypothetical protein HDU76_001757 [Blyttiomyces sp. JEL0837]
MFLKYQRDSIPRLLIHIPMRYFWMDELDYVLSNVDPIKLFFVARSCGHFDLFQHLYNEIFATNKPTSILVSNSKLSLSKLFSYIVQLAAERGYLDVIKFILTKVNIEDDESGSFNSFKECSKVETFYVVKFLAARSDVDAGVFDNEVLCTVAAYADLDTLKFLVGLPGVDPTARDNRAILNAAVGGYAKVVRFLLTVPGVHLRGHEDCLFACGAHGNSEAVRLWLQCSGVSASSISQFYLLRAILWGRVDIVKILVEFPGVDLTAVDDETLQMIKYRGMVKLQECLIGLRADRNRTNS